MNFDRTNFVKQAQKQPMVVRFRKKDNTIRDLVCTLEPSIINPTLKGGVRTSDPRDVTCVYDLENKGWRSFRNESVIEVVQAL